MTDYDIHSCGYYCDRPACIKAQRDELRQKLFSDQAVKTYSGGKPNYTQPEPCIHISDPKGCYRVRCQLGNKCVDDNMSLRAAPPQREWVGLTDDEMFTLWMRSPAETENRFAFARAIEAKLKEKNSTTEKNIQISDKKEAESARAWVGFTQEEHQAAIWTDGSYGAGFLHAEKLLKEKNT
jgi:hypothetical protein